MGRREFGRGTSVAAGISLVACMAVGSAGSAGAVSAAVSADPVDGYVERVYQDLLGRAVDPTGMGTWAVAVRVGAARAGVANGITASEEYRAALIDAAYDRYLDRGADAAGLASWLHAMRRGATVQQLEAGFLASPEYVAAASGAWVEAMYEDVLGRSAASAEAESWQALLAGGRATREGVALGILLSDEHLTAVVDAQYRELLGRGIDAVGRRGWVSALQAGARLEQVVAGIVASNEYYLLGIPEGGFPLLAGGRVGELPAEAAEADVVAYLTARFGVAPTVHDDTYACAAGEVPGRLLGWEGFALVVLDGPDGDGGHVAGWILYGDPTDATAALSTPAGLRLGDPAGRVPELYPDALAMRLDAFPGELVWGTHPDSGSEGFAVRTLDADSTVAFIGSGFFCGA